MKLKLNNLIYTVTDKERIEQLKEKGAIEVKEKKEVKKATAKTTAKAEKDA